MKPLLQDVLYDCNISVNKFFKNCDTCLKFKKTLVSPAVSMPLATKFNEAVAIGLKFWKNGYYIFYLIDMFSQFTQAEWTKPKDPEIIIDTRFSMWIGNGSRKPV